MTAVVLQTKKRTVGFFPEARAGISQKTLTPAGLLCRVPSHVWHQERCPLGMRFMVQHEEATTTEGKCTKRAVYHISNKLPSIPHGWFSLQLAVEPPVLGGHLHLQGFDFYSFARQKEQLNRSLDLQLSAETRNCSSGFLKDSYHLTQCYVSKMATCMAAYHTKTKPASTDCSYPRLGREEQSQPEV